MHLSGRTFDAVHLVRQRGGEEKEMNEEEKEGGREGRSKRRKEEAKEGGREGRRKRKKERKQ